MDRGRETVERRSAGQDEVEQKQMGLVGICTLAVLNLIKFYHRKRSRSKLG